MNAGSHVSICSIFYIKKVLISNEVQMYVIFFNLMAIGKKKNRRCSRPAGNLLKRWYRPSKQNSSQTDT